MAPLISRQGIGAGPLIDEAMPRRCRPVRSSVRARPAVRERRCVRQARRKGRRVGEVDRPWRETRRSARRGRPGPNVGRGPGGRQGVRGGRASGGIWERLRRFERLEGQALVDAVPSDDHMVGADLLQDDRGRNPCAGGEAPLKSAGLADDRRSPARRPCPTNSVKRQVGRVDRSGPDGCGGEDGIDARRYRRRLRREWPGRLGIDRCDQRAVERRAQISDERRQSGGSYPNQAKCRVTAEMMRQPLR